jgi:RNA polymerase sigma factor (sigma-70 family)
MAENNLAPILRHICKLAGSTEGANLTDAELLKRFVVRDDHDAFTALVHRHGPMVWRVCRRLLHQAADAEDAWQATFLLLARRAGSIRKPASLASWLHGTAFHIAHKVRSAIDRRPTREKQAVRPPVVDPGCEAAWRELGRIIEEQVHGLPDKYRLPLLLCYWEGATHEEAARRLSWPCGTVKTRLAAARRLLHKRLVHRGVTLPAGVVALLLAPDAANTAVPASLLHAAKMLAAIGPGCGGVSTNAAALAEEGIKRMAMVKGKVGLALILATCMAGAAALAHQIRSPRQPAKEPPSSSASLLQGAEPKPSDTERPRARTDLYGDPLPPGAVARLGTIHLRHTAGTDMVFSKDGKRLTSCDIGGEVRVWDVATGRLVRRTRLAWKTSEHQWQNPWHISLSPDGATAAAWDGGEKTTYLYDTATGRERGRLPGAEVLAISSDGKKIAVQGRDKEGNGPAQLWDLAEFNKHLDLDVPPGTFLRTAAFAPDGKQLAAPSGRSQELLVWDTATGKLRQQKKCRARVWSLTYAPDGATLAAGFDNSRDGVVLFDAATLKEKAALPSKAYSKGAGYSIWQLGFSLDGRLLAERRFFGGDQPQEHGLLIWDLSGPAKPRPLPTPTHIQSFALAPDGETLAYSYHNSNAIDLWDMAAGRRLHQLPGHDTPVYKLAVSPDGKILASSDWGPALRLWDTATGKPLRSLAGWDQFGSACLLFSADGRRLISVSRQGKLQIWDAATGKELCRFAINSPGAGVYPGYGVTLFDKGKRLAAVTGLLSTELSIWDAVTGEQLNRRSLSAVQPTSSKGHVELAPDGARATVWRGEDRLTIEDIATKSLLAILPEGVGHPLGFSADGRLLAVFLQPRKAHLMAWAEPNPIRERFDVKGLSLIETASGQEVVRLDIRRFDYVAFTPDGRALVVADKQQLSVWDTATGERLHQMAWPESVRDGHGYAKISSLAVLPGGRAATGMTEGDILLWDLAPSTWPARKPARDLGRKDLDALWADLAGSAGKAHRAIALLAAAPDQAVPFLKDHFRPVPVNAKRIEKLLADLEGDSFSAREAASRELSRLHYRVEPMLRRALAGKPSLEMRRRLQSILAEPKRPLPEDLRALRAIQVLERIGTPEARHILEKLTKGFAPK